MTVNMGYKVTLIPVHHETSFFGNDHVQVLIFWAQIWIQLFLRFETIFIGLRSLYLLHFQLLLLFRYIFVRALYMCMLCRLKNALYASKYRKTSLYTRQSLAFPTLYDEI